MICLYLYHVYYILCLLLVEVYCCSNLLIGSSFVDAACFIRVLGGCQVSTQYKWFIGRTAFMETLLTGGAFLEALREG